MRNTRSIGSFFLACSVLLSCSPAAAAPIVPEAEHECRATIQSSLRRWFQQSVRARQKCQGDTVLGFQDPSVDCLAGEADGALGKRLERAQAKLERSLARSCDGVDFGLLSYPGPCGDDATPLDAATLAECIVESGGESITTLFDVWYPETLSFTRGPGSSCLREVPKQAFGMVIDDLRLRLGCLLDVEGGGLAEETDCRAALVPAGPGTGEQRLDDALGRAHLSWLAGVPQSCALSDLDALGYAADCSDGGDGTLDLRDLRDCVYEANNDRMPFLLDLAFPSDPVCGNGILQEGEVCDDGLDNSDTDPDACREDCTLPTCGDGVTDPTNEEGCDDGNPNALDGCTPACVLEFCGDGIVNDSPAEECDDDNLDPADSCLNTCVAAACGDGIVCTAPSCTSGPEGGVEECDAGPDNSVDGACAPDCSGYRRTCTLVIGVTTSANLGALTYEIDYSAVDGDFLGNQAGVKCTSLVSGSLFSFFDNPVKRTVKESVINTNGFRAPLSVAQCLFATNEADLSPGAFAISVLSSSTPDFEDVPSTVAVTSINCTFE
jgi:cysteine-rich repeat protein